jgi:copper chaperone
MTSTTYPVKGMSCEHCVNAVTAELTGLDGVSTVTVDLVPEGVSLVTVVTDRPLDEEAVRAALDEAGGYLIARD